MLTNMHSLTVFFTPCFCKTKWNIVTGWDRDGDVSPSVLLQSEQHAGSLMFF